MARLPESLERDDENLGPMGRRFGRVFAGVYAFVAALKLDGMDALDHG